MLPIKTLGVRALVIKNNRVLLIKHSYINGWYTVGGGVKRGETPLQAIQRELFEEVGIECLDKPQLFNVYYSAKENEMIILCFTSLIILPNKKPVLLKFWIKPGLI